MKRIFVLALFITICLSDMSKVSAQTVETAFVDGLYETTSTGVKAPMPLPIIREADVMWEKTVWRAIDFRQKMNQGFYFPQIEHNNLRNLYTVLTDALEAGEITAYAADDDNLRTGELKTPIMYSTIKEDLARDEYKFDKSEIERCYVKEKWYFDKQRSQFLVRIIAIAPVRVLRDLNTKEQIRDPQVLFWVPYNDATRKVLAQAPFYNRNNSSNRLSYDEVFLNRMFDSYIYREDNIYDRSIADYADGVEALIESERIKQEIINKEQFLWEY